jgi:hypothetical protein
MKRLLCCLLVMAVLPAVAPTSHTRVNRHDAVITVALAGHTEHIPGHTEHLSCSQCSAVTPTSSGSGGASATEDLLDTSIDDVADKPLPKASLLFLVLSLYLWLRVR